MLEVIKVDVPLDYEPICPNAGASDEEVMKGFQEITT